jgi:hypothetical protein
MRACGVRGKTSTESVISGIITKYDPFRERHAEKHFAAKMRKKHKKKTGSLPNMVVTIHHTASHWVPPFAKGGRGDLTQVAKESEFATELNLPREDSLPFKAPKLTHPPPDLPLEREGT